MPAFFGWIICDWEEVEPPASRGPCRNEQVELFSWSSHSVLGYKSLEVKKLVISHFLSLSKAILINLHTMCQTSY